MSSTLSLPIISAKLFPISPEDVYRNVQGVTYRTYGQEKEFKEANISQSQARISSDEKFMLNSDPSISYANANGYWIIVMVVSSAAILFGFLIAFSKYRKKRKLQESYEEFSEVQMVRPKVPKSVDSSIYNYVCPQRSIDFVVPNIASSSLQNPADETSATDAPLLDENITSWSNLETYEGGRGLLGGLNPELYKVIPESSPEEVDFPEGNRGRLWFGAEYDTVAERLVVTLVKAKNLPSRVYGSINCCDPFVRDEPNEGLKEISVTFRFDWSTCVLQIGQDSVIKLNLNVHSFTWREAIPLTSGIHLMPDERMHLQSKMKKRTRNPRFDETFVFQVPIQNVQERALKFTVYDNDSGKHHNVIGHIVIPLSEICNASSDTALRWSDLERDANVKIPCDLGEIMLSLCYNQSLERLIVTVCEAKDLRMPERLKIIETYTKLILMKENKTVKSKKTMVVKNSRDPKYNESFHFRLSQNAINSTSVIAQVTQIGGKGKDKILGRVILGSHMFSRGKGLEHWDEAMSAGHKQIRYWHKLV